jgi:hypothetical protein
MPPLQAFKISQYIRNVKRYMVLEQIYDEFKRYVLKPFENGFDVEEWLFNESFKYFTKGIATIYLNRIDKDKYSIFNNKTIDALKALEYDLSKSFKT